MADVTVGKYYEQPVILRAKDVLDDSITVWHGEILIINPERARATRLQVFTVAGFAAQHGQHPPVSIARALRHGLPLVWVEPLDEARESYRPDLPCVQVDLLDKIKVDRKLYRLVHRNKEARYSADNFILERF